MPTTRRLLIGLIMVAMGAFLGVVAILAWAIGPQSGFRDESAIEHE